MHEIDESLGEPREDILEDAPLEVLAQFAGVFLALIQNSVDQRKQAFAPLPDHGAGQEGITAKQEPEIPEGVTRLGPPRSLIGEHVRQIVSCNSWSLANGRGANRGATDARS